QSKLVKYFSRQLSCKRKVALQERNAKLEGFPQLLHWFRIVDIRKEVMEEIAPGQLSLEDLLDMTDEQVCATVEKFGANSEECARLNASLSCLRSVHKSGGSLSKQDWTIQWPSTEPGKENSPGCPPEPGPWGRTHPSPKVQPKCGQHHCHASSSHGPMYTHVDRLTVEGHPGLCPPLESGHRSLPPSPRQRHAAHTPPRTPNIVTTMTPPGTPPVRRRNKLKPPGTPPPSSRKLIHLIPGFTALHRSKSHEFQLGHRVDEAHTPKKPPRYSDLHVSQTLPKTNKLNKVSPEPPVHTLPQGQHPLHPNVHSLAENHGDLLSGKDLLRKSSLFPQHGQGHPCPMYPCATLLLNDSTPALGSYARVGQLFSRGNVPKIHPEPPLAQPEAVPSPPVPVPWQQSPTPGLSPPGRDLCRATRAPEPPLLQPEPLSSSLSLCWGSSPFPPSFPALDMYPIKLFILKIKWEQHFLSSLDPAVPRAGVGSAGFFPHSPPCFIIPETLCPPQNEEGAEEVQESEDDFEEMNLSLLSARNFPRKASQTSIFLQEWDIPFEQLEIGELIGKGRFGQVFHGRWHGEVAIRLIDIERDNEDQLKAFKREVMAYRQTRHENVVLFMGACMSPPHLAIITSLCKGRTLYSVVRDAKIVLDVNKTRQIAQEIVKGMGYLHAKGILHKDLKSKNVFYDNGKVVITDFGLFSISGVLQAGRRENKLRIQNGWLCHLAPEIIRQLSPDTEEDKLPFSKHSDVFALGTIWYELHAREWPFKTQPAEAIIWQVGRGMKPNLSQIGMGKEISDILLFCWAYEQEERPTFTKLMDMLEKLPKRNRRLSHPGHFWKSAE
ncbi:KSR2 Kinase, partial [Spelaeornis formosus]|nr:KSR2 Kinase [Elachura formosa]